MNADSRVLSGPWVACCHKPGVLMLQALNLPIELLPLRAQFLETEILIAYVLTVARAGAEILLEVVVVIRHDDAITNESCWMVPRTVVDVCHVLVLVSLLFDGLGLREQYRLMVAENFAMVLRMDGLLPG